MIALFQAVSSYKTGTRSARKFNQSSTARWVPVNKSFVALVKMILRSATGRLGLGQAAVTLRCLNHQGYRHLLLADNKQELYLAASGGCEEFIISTQEPISSPFQYFDAEAALSLPVNFKPEQTPAQRLGYLVVELPTNLLLSPEKLRCELDLVVEEIVRVISRYQTRYRSINCYGDQSYWIGNSNALRQLDQRMDHLAKGTKPVLIRANKGTGKLIAARSMHDLVCAESAPFIESDCREWESGTAAAILQSLRTCASGGSLFLRNINALNTVDMHELRRFCLWLAASTGGVSDRLRLTMTLGSASVDLAPATDSWLRQICAELVLPELRERSEDLRDLVQFFMREFALAGELDLTEQAWQLLAAAHWPDNVDSLKNLIKKLALISDGSLIHVDELHSLL